MSGGPKLYRMHDLHELSTRVLTMDFYPELMLARGPLNSEGHTTLCLARKDTSSDAQKFKLSPVVSGQTYLITCKDGEVSLDVMYSYIIPMRAIPTSWPAYQRMSEERKSGLLTHMIRTG